MAGARRDNLSPLDAAADRQIQRVLSRLPGVERSVIELRFGLAGGHPIPAADVAGQLNLTAREVGEIERRALGRLRQVLDPAAAASLARLLTRLST
jgi:RNA polymerase nonessential primary-like sigma factor